MNGKLNEKSILNALLKNPIFICFLRNHVRYFCDFSFLIMEDQTNANNQGALTTCILTGFWNWS